MVCSARSLPLARVSMRCSTDGTNTKGKGWLTLARPAGPCTKGSDEVHGLGRVVNGSTPTSPLMLVSGSGRVS